MDKLFSTEGLRITVDSLELSGDYRTAFDIGEDFDFTGMQVKALSVMVPNRRSRGQILPLKDITKISVESRP